MAHAETQDEMLQKTYQSCIGNDTDPNREAYCACVRDGMRHWSMDDFGEVAGQMAASPDATKTPPDKIAALAKECISKVLR